MRLKNWVKRVAFYTLQFNLLFAVLYLISSLFGEPDIPFVKWMALCDVIFLVIILPYLMYMDSRRSRS